VSFVNTPIYMFTATFVISFGIKKGNLSAYSSYWYSDFKNNFQLLNFTLPSNYLTNSYSNLMAHRFQFTSITSRSTTYLLFTFWCFFFFFGELLLLVLFNYNTVSDSVPSYYFFNTKSHVIFWLNSSSSNLTTTIMFYILFLSTCSFNFLLRLDLFHTYNSLSQEVGSDIIFFLIILYLLKPGLIYLLLVLYLLGKLYKPTRYLA
jgi:hypothetical protein